MNGKDEIEHQFITIYILQITLTIVRTSVYELQPSDELHEKH